MRKAVFVIFAAAGILFAAALSLNGIRENNAQAHRLTLMRTLLPGSSTFAVEPYDGTDPNIRSVYRGETGFVIRTVTSGYAGEITMSIGVSKEGRVTGLVVEKMEETRGLGSRALNGADFLAQFLNTSGDAQVGTNVDALTGATVTSKAIARSVNSASAFVTGADTASGATSWGG